MQHSLVYASKSTLPSNEANAVHVVQMCDAFASQLQTVVLRGKRGAAHRPIEELYGLRNQFRVVYESAISRKLWLHALRLRAWLFGVSPGVIYYGRRMNALRSEEHTSELQSLMRISYAVFCSKKKTRDVCPAMITFKESESHTKTQ